MLVFGPFLGIFLVRHGWRGSGAFRPFGNAPWALAPVLGAGAALVAIPLQAGMQHLTGRTLPDGMQALLRGVSPAEIGLAILTFCLVAPFLEEALARGAMFERTRLLRGPGVAVLASTLVFMLWHPVPVAWPTYTWLGLVLAMFRLACGAWGPGVLVHATFNACALLLARFPAGAVWLETPAGRSLALLVGAVVVGGVVRWTLRAGRV
ncbi:MAG: CPBP family intramembrane glutamic endopeptidase [bacterium]|nr:CPBP family intramembrane glutamic endopeptidase [bacterium]